MSFYALKNSIFTPATRSLDALQNKLARSERLCIIMAKSLITPFGIKNNLLMILLILHLVMSLQNILKFIKVIQRIGNLKKNPTNKTRVLLLGFISFIRESGRTGESRGQGVEREIIRERHGKEIKLAKTCKK